MRQPKEPDEPSKCYEGTQQTSFPPHCPENPDSPDLNSIDHKVWGMMQEQVYHTPIHDVNYLMFVGCVGK